MISFLAEWGLFVPLDMVYRVYFRNADVVKAFGFADQIPTWYVPPPESNVQIMRTFFHPDWVAPFGLYIVNYLLSWVLALALGFWLLELYVNVEKLPFPIQQVTAQQILTVSEGEESAVNLLFTASIFGFIWGFIVYSLPNLIRSYTGQYIQFVPIPWVDLTFVTERFFPGGMFGILTDLSPIITAFVLGKNMIISMIIGSLAVWFFGNWLSVNYNLAIQPWWLPGMSSEFIYSRSTLYLWAVPLIGFSLAAGLMPVIRHPKRIYKALTSVRAAGMRGSRLKWFIILGITLSTAGGMILYYLLTDFPLFLAAPMFAFAPLILSMINSQMVGETGVNIDVDVPLNLIYYGSGYPGVEVWFVPTIINVEGTYWLRTFRVAQLTDTSIWSVIKAEILFTPLTWIVGYLFVQLYWSMAPIPSGMYPGARIFWRVGAINRSIWIKGREIGLFNPYWLIGAFIVGVAVYFVAGMTGFLTSIGLAAGAYTTPHAAMMLLIGLLIKTILSRSKGEAWWRRNNLLLAAGLGIGTGIAVAISVAISLIVTSIRILPI